MRTVIVFFVLFGVIICHEECQQRMFTGYKVDYRLRDCVTSMQKACVNPFPYHTMAECKRDFRGRGNICEKRKRACRNGGTCMAVRLENGQRSFKCQCSGTGYHGNRCQHKCRKDTKARACIVA